MGATVNDEEKKLTLLKSLWVKPRKQGEIKILTPTLLFIHMNKSEGFYNRES